MELLLPTLALAVLSSLSGDPAFEEGLRLYRGLEYEQAIFRFEEVAVRPGLEPADKATALLWLGLSYAGTGDVDASKRNLRQALVVDDTIALPPSAPPRIAALFEELRTGVKQEKAAHPVDDKPPAPPPPPPPAPPPPKSNLPFIGGAAATGVGALALLSGGALTFVAFGELAKAKDKTGFQDDAKAALDDANGAGIAATILIPAGALLAGAGAVVLVLNGE